MALTCMISKSCTYLRSVSTISRTMLFRAASFEFDGAGGGAESARESYESWEARKGGEGGASSQASSGR